MPILENGVRATLPQTVAAARVVPIVTGQKQNGTVIPLVAGGRTTSMESARLVTRSPLVATVNPEGQEAPI